MKYTIYLLLFLNSFIYASSPSHTELQLYPNVSFLSYFFDKNTDIIQIDLPEYVRKEDINIDTKCNIIKTTLSDSLKIEDSSQKIVDKLSLDIKTLHKKIETLDAKIKLIKSYSFKNLPLSSLKENGVIYEELLFKSLKRKDILQEDLEKLNKKIQKYTKKRNFNAIKHLNLNLKCNENSITKVFFPIRDISYNGFSKFNANTRENYVDITQIALISHSLGNFLKKVDIKLYSFFYSTSMNPYAYIPKYIDVQKQIQKNIISIPNNMLLKQDMPQKSKKLYSQFQEKNLRTFRVWEVKNVELIAGKDNKIIFNTQRVPAIFRNYIDGYGSQKAYIEAKIKPKESIIQSKSTFVVDGLLVGEKYIDNMKKDEEENIFFGVNNFIKIEKKLDEDFTDKTLFGNKQTTQKIWHYNIINQGLIEEKIVLVEQVPISKNEDIQVELIADPKQNKQEKNGKILWNFTLKPHNNKKIKFGYNVKKPHEKQ